jgi:hypothetical protein
VFQTNAFIQLITISNDQVDFILNGERGQEDKIEERPRESEGERESECGLGKDKASVVKQTIRK